MKLCYFPIFGLLVLKASATTTAFPLSPSSPFLQDWTSTTQISANDDWSGVPSIVGYLGSDLVAVTGADPQTILTTGIPVIDAIANQTNPNTLTAGGVAEFEIANPTIALQGSGTADAPNLILYLDATNAGQITVSYLLRDLDGSIDNSIQAVALQYRIGGTGDFTNVPGGFVADATTGPSLATSTTAVSALLPSSVNGSSLLEIRMITSNAVGNDEWVGIDDISVVAAIPEPATGLLGAIGLLGLLRRRR